MQGAVNQQLYEYAMQWQQARRGTRGAVLHNAAEALGLSVPTLHRKFKLLVATEVRKRRADCGQLALSFKDAQAISTVLVKHMRKNGKRLTSVSTAIEQCRANGLIRAQRIDDETGEVLELHANTVARILRHYGLHPEQLSRPAPAVSMASPHPNYCWQIDASRSVLFYLPTTGEVVKRGARGKAERGLQTMDERVFYKNKPANQIHAIKHALWRYVITDHASGWIYVHYVVGGETSQNLIEAFIGAMVQSPDKTMYGVPKIVMLDAGSANTSAAFKNLCHALQVRVLVNQVGNPRAKGQVEKAQDIVEKEVESLFLTMPAEAVDSVPKINALAWRVMRVFNRSKVHSRTGQTRDAVWNKISAQQLVAAPSAEVLRQVAVSAPQSRLVSPQLTVQFNGCEYDVSSVPNVLVGEQLMICRNAFAENGAQAIGHNAEGFETFYILPERKRGEFGFVVDAPVIGQSYKRHAETTLQKNSREIEGLSMPETAKGEGIKRTASQKSSFMGGHFDPLAHIARKEVEFEAKAANSKVITLPRRETLHALSASGAPAVIEPPLTHIQAAKRLKAEFTDWNAAHYEQLLALYPRGVPVDELEAAGQSIREVLEPQAVNATRHLMRVA